MSRSRSKEVPRKPLPRNWMDRLPSSAVVAYRLLQTIGRWLRQEADPSAALGLPLSRLTSLCELSVTLDPLSPCLSYSWYWTNGSDITIETFPVG